MKREMVEKSAMQSSMFGVRSFRSREPRTSSYPYLVSLIPHVSRGGFPQPAPTLLPDQSVCKDTFGSSTYMGEGPTRKEQIYASKD